MEETKNNELFSLDSLPSGYRFNPTDGEIIIDYLRKKVDHQPLPMDKIIEVNLYDHDPDQLAATYKPLGKDEWFYFTPRDRKYPNGQRPNRSVGGSDKDKNDDKKVGYWKATGSDKPIKHKDQKVGYRKALVFYRGTARDGVKTNWIMHEFRVADPPKPPPRTAHENNNMRLDDCVLCRVYRKEERDCKKSQEEGGGIGESNQSSPKTPRFEFNPNEDVNDVCTDGDGIMDSVEERNNYQCDPSMDSYQTLQHQLAQQQPINQMGQQPMIQIGHQPMIQMGQQPISQMGQQPITQMSQKPIVQMGQQFIIKMGQQPIVKMSQQPITQIRQQPITQMGQISRSNVASCQENLQIVAPPGEYHVMQSTEFSFPDETWDMYGYEFGFDYR